ncbi:MAG: hypothetical protein HYW05_04770 [Candidatus Diapherotrites archaeon]|nr:hypothetical protein [Candidatus Diapherotrites archaeon]
MVSEVVIDTIRKMLASGMSEESVKGMLADIGLSRQETEEAISKAGGAGQGKQAPSRELEELPSGRIERLPEHVAERVKEHLEARSTESELRDLIQQTALEEHGSRLGEVKERVEDLHRKVSALHPAAAENYEDRLAELEAQVNELGKDIKDIKALSSALQLITKKILETDRGILEAAKRRK